ncbi:MAG: hypothetical protein A3J27_06570 [Candidatus Tectomicrobia bacterium RIFCSPLOWO2_12_FULL_69_37]|nr:MAG: hypothetical protein A3J27_06570 [Candidatus Tectomicrobia bacterium RIFCSPLOWO2_12_FULL_69_37]OGL65552.1 MAG: hypothetical protein A3I72_16535 [Candidatus Tectomicrobia bacterium RIFCSPLOWO2_02_FULL_70_19]
MAGPDEKTQHPDADTGGRRRAPEEASARPGGGSDRRNQGRARHRDPACFLEDITRFHRTLEEGYGVLQEAHDRWKKYTERKNMLAAQVETEKAKEKEICQNALKIFLTVDTEIRQIYTPMLEYIKRHVDESEKTKDQSLKEKVHESRWDGRGRLAIALFKQTSLALGFLSAFINEEDQDEDFQARYREVVTEQKERLEKVPFSSGAYTKLGEAMRRAADHRSFDRMTRLSSQIVQEFIDFPEEFMKKYASAAKNPVPTALTT